jgi:hypothetical protein
LNQDEVRVLAERLAQYIAQGLGTRSKCALRWALDAAEHEGVSGSLVLQIPGKTKDYPNVSFIPDWGVGAA